MLNKELLNEAGETLILEQCPEPVQVMAPTPAAHDWPLLAMVCGNVLLGAALITGLLLTPYWLGRLIGLIQIS